MTAPPPAPESSDLCTQCGLCCDGSLFNQVVAYPEDVASLHAQGITLATDSDRLAFRIPCPRLDGACCTIYPDRFVTCRKFRCKLLLKLDAGAIDAAQGLTTIATARGLIDALPPDERTVTQRQEAFQQTKAFASVTHPAERMVMAKRHLALVALDRYLNLHFRKIRDPAATEKA